MVVKPITARGTRKKDVLFFANHNKIRKRTKRKRGKSNSQKKLRWERNENTLFSRPLNRVLHRTEL